MFDDLKIPSNVGHIAGRSNLPQTEAILHIVLKFQFNHAFFHGGEAGVLLVRLQTCNLHAAGWIPG